jgi:mycofactocin precursor
MKDVGAMGVRQSKRQKNRSIRYLLSRSCEMEKTKIDDTVANQTEGIAADARILRDIIEEVEIEDLTVDGICGVY